MRRRRSDVTSSEDGDSLPDIELQELELVPIADFVKPDIFDDPDASTGDERDLLPPLDDRQWNNWELTPDELTVLDQETVGHWLEGGPNSNYVDDELEYAVYRRGPLTWQQSDRVSRRALFKIELAVLALEKLESRLWTPRDFLARPPQFVHFEEVFHLVACYYYLSPDAAVNWVNAAHRCAFHPLPFGTPSAVLRTRVREYANLHRMLRAIAENYPPRQDTDISIPMADLLCGYWHEIIGYSTQDYLAVAFIIGHSVAIPADRVPRDVIELAFNLYRAVSVAHSDVTQFVVPHARQAPRQYWDIPVVVTASARIAHGLLMTDANIEEFVKFIADYDEKLHRHLAANELPAPEVLRRMLNALLWPRSAESVSNCLQSTFEFLECIGWPREVNMGTRFVNCVQEWTKTKFAALRLAPVVSAVVASMSRTIEELHGMLFARLDMEGCVGDEKDGYLLPKARQQKFSAAAATAVTDRAKDSSDYGTRSRAQSM